MRGPIAKVMSVFMGIAMVMIAGTILVSQAESKLDYRARGEAVMDSGDSVQAKIERAMSAGPAEIAQSAKIVDKDAQGQTVVLRGGSNEWTCMPGNPSVVGQPAMCMDRASMQWFADFAAHKPKPTNTVPGITYMLAGATQRSDSDPFDKTSPPITVPPHWMIMWAFDAKQTGLPTTHRDTGAYIMWSGTPWAHVHVMGRPAGNQ